MPDWNPHAPALVGCEWPGARQRVLPIGAGNGAGPRIGASSTQTIDSITTLTRTPAGPQPLIICDVYDLANPVLDDAEPIIAVPISSLYADAGWQMYNSGTLAAMNLATAYQRVDDPVGDDQPTTTGQADALVSSVVGAPGSLIFDAGAATFYHGDTGASGASITGKRLRRVDVVAIVSNQSNAPITVCGYLQDAAVPSPERSASITLAPGVLQRVRFPFYINNRIGGLPWNHAHAVEVTDGTWHFGIGVLSKPGAGFVGVSAVNLQLLMSAERRLVTGFGFGQPGKDAWSIMACLDPLDYTSKNFAKVSGHDYFVMFTALRASSAIVGVSVSGVANPKIVQLSDTQLESVALGTQGVGVPVSDVIPDIDAMNCLLHISGGAYSSDSNPYAGVSSFVCGADGGASYRQDVSGSGTFQNAAILVSGDGRQDAPLTIQLKRGASVLASATISPDDPDAPSDGRPTLVKRPLSAGVTFSGGEYLQVSSTSTHGWVLPCMFTRGAGMTSADATAVAAATAGIGGSGASANSDTTADFPWWVGTIPATPTGLAGAQANFTTANPSPGGPARISYAALDWTSTSLGGDFDHYELLRNGNVIAAITTESASFFNDFELKRGVANSYQVRVVRADGAVSNLSTAVLVTVTSPKDCDEILTSNARPDLTLAYQSAPGHAYGRPSSDLANAQIIAGRKAPFVVRPLTEGNADTLSRVYTIQMNAPTSTPTTIDRAVFAPLVALVEAAVPYVAVCAGNGDRWFASGKLSSGSMVFSQPGNAHRATVAWTEVDTVPATILTAAPWQP